jgi:hypothetical protein
MFKVHQSSDTMFFRPSALWDIVRVVNMSFDAYIFRLTDHVSTYSTHVYVKTRLHYINLKHDQK